MPEAPGQFDGQPMLFGGSEPDRPVVEAGPTVHQPDAAQAAFSRVHETGPQPHALDVHGARTESALKPTVDDSEAQRDHTSDYLSNPISDLAIQRSQQLQAETAAAARFVIARAEADANGANSRAARAKAEAALAADGGKRVRTRSEIRIQRLHDEGLGHAVKSPQASAEFPLRADTVHEMGHMIEGLKRAQADKPDIKHAS